MKLSDIHIRDPFVLADGGRYYLYGTRGKLAWKSDGITKYGFDVYTSDDLENWSGARSVFEQNENFWSDRDYWAPEVHKYEGKYYMFASFKSENHRRCVQILVSDTPDGSFALHSDGPVTPAEWECLDGTLYVEDGEPYMIFCHEWVQVKDGEMCAVKLSRDLKRAEGEPFLLFKASQPEWANKTGENFVTDGPFMFRGEKLYMLWSSGKDGHYVQAVSCSENGRLRSRWIHDTLLFEKDGGHGMIFTSAEGKKLLSLHRPNVWPNERPVFFPVGEKNGRLCIEE